ncbi:MAG: hypothetical protein K0S60_368 [Evtepia sp.]|jgi:glyoxylase-like metal-dependent hydrolase (beta-lactamase superfamily II)|nr:hypothetical protein [Evtepia sp.]
MIVKHIQVGQIGTNCYLFGDETAKVCAVVDPGDQAHQIAKMVNDSGLNLQYILVTHGHFDHVLAVPELLEFYPNAQVYIHRSEVNERKLPNNYMQMPLVPNLHYYEEGDTLPLGSLTIEVMHTPGHSLGSVVLRVEDVLFSGDTLFQGACGRTDFAGGSYSEMLHSLKRLHDLPGNFQVYPGHEGFTTLEQERKRNNYMLEAVNSLR